MPVVRPQRMNMMAVPAMARGGVPMGVATPSAAPARLSLRGRFAALMAGQAGLAALWIGGLAMLLGSGLYHTRGLWLQGQGQGQGEPSAAAPQPLPNEDPVARFEESRIGHLLFMLPDGQTCRRVLFDNTTGRHREVGTVDCAPDEPVSANALATGRIDAIRNSFKR